MSAWNRKLSRRQLLALGGAGVAAGLLDRAFAQGQPEGQVIRIGMVLPTQTGETSVRASAYQLAANAARSGAIMAEEELGFNAELLGQRLEVRVATAPDTDSAVRAAERMLSTEELVGFAGGYGDETALALSQVASSRQIPFLNIGSASDALRGASCDRYTFHIEASAAMYLDALTAWYVRSAFRRWFYVYPDSDAGRALYDRARRSLTERHFGAEEVGSIMVPADSLNFTDAISKAQNSNPEVILLLTDAVSQLAFMGEYDNAGGEAEVTGFPDPSTQTRTFLAASRNEAPNAGTGFRASLWEAKIDAYGAREINQRFRERWGMPMDGPAWAAYQAVKMLYEATSLGNGMEADDIISYFENPTTNFDVWKGIGVSFRPWDHQLRQSLYLIKINSDAETAFDLANLVGELPALYLPGTDPLERLDQLGDLERASQCNF